MISKNMLQRNLFTEIYFTVKEDDVDVATLAVLHRREGGLVGGDGERDYGIR